MIFDRKRQLNSENHPFHICLNQGRLVRQIRAAEGCERVGGGGVCLKFIKMGWNRKEGRGNKNFKKGGKLGQGVDALKGGGGSYTKFT